MTLSNALQERDKVSKEGRDEKEKEGVGLVICTLTIGNVKIVCVSSLFRDM